MDSIFPPSLHQWVVCEIFVVVLVWHLCGIYWDPLLVGLKQKKTEKKKKKPLQPLSTPSNHNTQKLHKQPHPGMWTHY